MIVGAVGLERPGWSGPESYKEEAMRFLTTHELARRSNAELSVLFNEFNLALARAEPFSEDWHIAHTNLDTIMRVRNQRLQQFRR